jgi:hypothetical protein
VTDIVDNQSATRTDPVTQSYRLGGDQINFADFEFVQSPSNCAYSINVLLDESNLPAEA